MYLYNNTLLCSQMGADGGRSALEAANTPAAVGGGSFAAVGGGSSGTPAAVGVGGSSVKEQVCRQRTMFLKNSFCSFLTDSHSKRPR